MEKISKFLLILFPILTSVLLSSKTVAYITIPLWKDPAFTSQPLIVPAIGEKNDILIDNFEYWDSPHNHGWLQYEPSYPIYGYGIGYAIIFTTVLDLQEGSRVLDVYRPSSIFLLGTPYEKHYITRSFDDIGGIILDPNIADPPQTLPCTQTLSFKFRAPIGIEPWDIFEFNIIGTTPGPDLTPDSGDDGSFLIKIKPTQPPYGSNIKDGGNTTGKFGGYLATLVQAGSNTSPMIIQVEIGRNFLDGSWHVIWLDLKEVNQIAHNGFVPKDWELVKVTQILVGGRMFRLDDIIFRASLIDMMEAPDLFEPGPLYAQIFEPYRYLFYADYGRTCLTLSDSGNHAYSITDLMLDHNNFVIDPNKIKAIWVADGADPKYWDTNDPNYGHPDPNISLLMGRSFVVEAAEMRVQGPLGWNATIGSYGAHGIQTQSITTPGESIVQPLPINPYDGMPTYFPTYFSAICVIEKYGRPHYTPSECFMLESALWNAGIKFWPNIAYMDYAPQVFEDLIVTLEVTDGFNSDIQTFPISVVNYPVENYPPVIQQDIDDQVFYVGATEPIFNKYPITFFDPDCSIFSMAQFEGREPATSHVPGWPYNEISPYAPPQKIRTDQDRLIYRMILNNLPSYQYGPWIDTIIDPHSGLIRFTPKFEGAYPTKVICTDDRGASAFGEITIFCINKGTWLNHPPILTDIPTVPQVTRAGKEFILHAPNFFVVDPDGDELYASCNIGSCGRSQDGAFIWTFQSNFPGLYNVEIIFYDIRGGYAIMSFQVEVKPWWSY